MKLRKCVVGVIANGDGTYLVGERAGLPGTWQFPQGGIEVGESPQQALGRELMEEIGCGEVEIIRSSKTPVDYIFPPDLRSRITKTYAGQSQTWFLVRFKAGAVPDLAKSDGEFQQLTWLKLSDIVSGIVDWKRVAYIDGLTQLGVWPEAQS
jgi:putative (di)nucleoside polyphosphate hydrolase